MRIFLDTANIEEIRQAAKMGVISGVTTNPSLMSREKGADFKATVQEICFIVGGSVSAEVTSMEADGMVAEAVEMATWSPYATIKVPITAAGLEALHRLSTAQGDAERVCNGCAWQSRCSVYPEAAKDIVTSQGISTNATLAFSPNQALLSAIAGATYVSPFVGRLDDVGHEGMQVVADTVEIFERYGLETQVIAASIRHPLHVTQAAKAGADIATVPFAVLTGMIKHPLTDVGIKRFLEDWEKFKAGR